jgi:hypothetical protein
MTPPACQLLDPAPRDLCREGQTPCSGCRKSSPEPRQPPRESWQPSRGLRQPSREPRQTSPSTPTRDAGDSEALFCITDPFAGDSAGAFLQQRSAALHQKSSAQELAQVNLQQENLARQPGKPSRLLRKGALQQNKPAGYPGRVVPDARERCSASKRLCRAPGWFVLMQRTGSPDSRERVHGLAKGEDPPSPIFRI